MVAVLDPVDADRRREPIAGHLLRRPERIARSLHHERRRPQRRQVRRAQLLAACRADGTDSRDRRARERRSRPRRGSPSGRPSTCRRSRASPDRRAPRSRRATSRAAPARDRDRGARRRCAAAPCRETRNARRGFRARRGRPRRPRASAPACRRRAVREHDTIARVLGAVEEEARRGARIRKLAHTEEIAHDTPLAADSLPSDPAGPPCTRLSNLHRRAHDAASWRASRDRCGRSVGTWIAPLA